MVPETESEQGVKDDDVRAAWGEYKRLVEDAMRQEAQDQVLPTNHYSAINLKISRVNSCDSFRINITTIVLQSPAKIITRQGKISGSCNFFLML